MDINFNLNNEVFNYRVACIIKKNKEYLVAEKKATSVLSLMGGRVKIGETSIEAILREVKEETNLDTIYVKSLGLIENFFISKYNNKPYHELLIIHELAFKNKEDYEKNSIINLEEGVNSVFVWKTKEELEQNVFNPKIILDYLDTNTFFHLINKD